MSCTCARILRDVGRFKQSGNKRNASRPGGNQLAEIFDLYSADAKNRDRDFVMDPLDTPLSDRLVIRLRWSGENRTEPDVIRAFAFRRNRLLQTVSRFSDENVAASFLACVRKRVVVLSEMNSFHWNLGRNFRVIVHD